MPRGWTAEPSPDPAPALTPPQAAAWRRGQGMVCLAARCGAGEPAGVTWVTAAAFDEDEAWLRFEPPSGAGWDTGLYVAPEHRGGRAFAALWAGTRAWAEAQGLRWSMSRIADYGLASRRAHQRMGAVEVGRVAALRLGGVQLSLGAKPALARRRPIVRPGPP